MKMDQMVGMQLVLVPVSDDKKEVLLLVDGFVDTKVHQRKNDSVDETQLCQEQIDCGVDTTQGLQRPEQGNE